MPAPAPAVDRADLDRIADSFALAHADAATIGQLFYQTLFMRAPHLKPLFKTDLDRQGIKMMDALNVVVAAIGYPDIVRPTLEDLARRHVVYGVEPQHYAEIGQAMVATLTQFLGPDRFDAETSAAWERAFRVLSQMMISAAYPDLAP